MNKKDLDNLENKFLYRLIKVACITAFLVLGSLVVILGWTQKPYQYVDEDKSYVTCVSNNSQYTFNAIDKYISTNSKEVEARYNVDSFSTMDEKAQFTCDLAKQQFDLETQSRIKTAREAGVPEDQIMREATEYQAKKNATQTPPTPFTENVDKLSPLAQSGVKLDLGESKAPQKQYGINNVYTTNGSWQNVIIWWTLGLLGVYVGLNIIKEALLYVFLGKKFTWHWFRWLFLK